MRGAAREDDEEYEDGQQSRHRLLPEAGTRGQVGGEA